MYYVFNMESEVYGKGNTLEQAYEDARKAGGYADDEELDEFGSLIWIEGNEITVKKEVKYVVDKPAVKKTTTVAKKTSK